VFRGLRLRLTLLYLAVALALIALLGGGTYLLLNRYFQQTTDLALQYRLAQEFRLRGIPLPQALASAEAAWATARLSPLPVRSSESHNHDGDDHRRPYGRDDNEFDAELAPIFIMPLDASGQIMAASSEALPPFAPNVQAVAAAMQNGSDWRTVQLSDGTRLRLLTWRVPGNPPAVFQVGRVLTDQSSALRQLLMALLALGGVAALLLGAGSWWLAGRALRPVQVAWERQQAFVANASHELRTPLTLMRASAEMAMRHMPAHDAEQRMLLQDVVQECDHTGRLVDDLLLLSRLDARQLALERQPVLLADMFADIERQVGRLAAARRICLTVDHAGYSVLGDATRLRQVLLILLDNALRYTPEGGTIQLAARRHGQHVTMTVSDSGSGIAPQDLPRVFERFYRADSVRTAPGGSGLGLAIAKALVEAQHGHITIQSQPGHGTQVMVTLPAA
jgi:signal transduction histidine kinase